ncbi:MAG: hypothetical protein RL536_75, partial [Candidatus Parcubacteria bacterium]
MPPYDQIDPVPVVNVSPPSIDLFSFLETIFHKLVDWYPAIFGGAKT